MRAQIFSVLVPWFGDWRESLPRKQRLALIAAIVEQRHTASHTTDTDFGTTARRLSSRFPQAAVSGIQLGSKRHIAATAETKGCARAHRHACDSQPRDRSGSAVGYPALRRCVLAARFQQWSFQRPLVTISNRKAGRSIPRAASPTKSGHPRVHERCKWNM
jgi:hypothetical protein